VTTDLQPWAAIPATGPLLRPKDAAEYLGYSKSQFYALAERGELPAPIKIGRGHNGAAGVPRPWLDAIIAARAGGAQ
jgi:excisionase family DNA binding protein